MSTNILAQSFAISVAELKATYTWRTWIFGWLFRLVAQVSYFALVGSLVGSTEAMRFIVIGNIALLPCLEATIVIISVSMERMTGTLPLLVVSPSSHVPIYLGRGVQWLATGFASSFIALLLVPPLSGMPVSPEHIAAAVPILLVIGLSSYCYGCFLAGVGLRRTGLHWVLLNLSYIVVMTFCGVNAPLSFWPEPIQVIVNLFPVTHGLQAMRVLLDGGPTGQVLSSLALEVAVGAGWLLLAAVSLNRLVARGRLDGTLDNGT